MANITPKDTTTPAKQKRSRQNSDEIKCPNQLCKNTTHPIRARKDELRQSAASIQRYGLTIIGKKYEKLCSWRDLKVKVQGR